MIWGLLYVARSVPSEASTTSSHAKIEWLFRFESISHLGSPTWGAQCRPCVTQTSIFVCIYWFSGCHLNFLFRLSLVVAHTVLTSFLSSFRQTYELMSNVIIMSNSKSTMKSLKIYMHFTIQRFTFCASFKRLWVVMHILYLTLRMKWSGPWNWIFKTFEV